MKNRTIKFRAWFNEDGLKSAKMVEWDEIKQQSMLWLNRKSEFTYMQFTGILDKNGKEIYEGDIVKLPYIDPFGGLHQETENGRSKIGFENGQFVVYRIEPQGIIKWCEKEKGEYVSNYGNLVVVKDKTIFEIIGNIYENPELLTSQ